MGLVCLVTQASNITNLRTQHIKMFLYLLQNILLNRFEVSTLVKFFTYLQDKLTGSVIDRDLREFFFFCTKILGTKLFHRPQARELVTALLITSRRANAI